jgi:SAM-dependent methyltransferase
LPKKNKKETETLSQKFIIQPDYIQHENGYCYIVALPSVIPPGDSVETQISSIRLFENGREIGQPHSFHSDIRTKGKGLYSHWGRSLYFSTSDNTDPRKNKRIYSLEANLSVQKILKLVEDLETGGIDCFQLNDAINSLLEKSKLVNSSIIYDIYCFELYNRIYTARYGKKPDIVVELGPGKSGGVLLLFLYNGTKLAYSVDPFPILEIQPKKFFELVLKFNLFKSLCDSQYFQSNVNIIEIEAKKKYQINQGTFEHFPSNSGESLPFSDNSIDYLYSNAVLEHVIDPEQTLKEIYRVLKKGGITAHQVDLRDHRDFTKPLEFLTYSQEEWNRELAEIKKGSPSNHMNRWRFNDWKAGLMKVGFEIEEFYTNMFADKAYLQTIQPKLHSDFRSLSEEELQSISIFFVAKKS